MKKLLYLLIPLIFCVSLVYILFFTTTEDSKVVSEAQIKSAKFILFYRKDCSDCKELLEKKGQEIHQKDMLLVDLTEKANQKYQEEYGLVSVPTLFVGKKEYIGTQYITQYLETL